MVFNIAMTKHTDAKLIDDFGGPAKVADLLGLPKYGGVQRVQNWTVRGIPSAMKVKHPEMFMPSLASGQTGHAAAATENVAQVAV